jgi:hypothetical protein
MRLMFMRDGRSNGLKSRVRNDYGARSCRLELESLEGRQLLASVIAEISTPLAGSTKNFITFQVPGSTSTSVLAINDAGTAVGFTGNGLGYLRDAAGNLTSFSVPGLTTTLATDINNAGTVVGYNTAGYGPGFLRDASGHITTFQIPGIPPGFLTGIFTPRINDAGIIAGNYDSPMNVTHGFSRDLAGNITTFDAPGSTSTRVEAINNAGTILGTSDSPNFPNYLRDAAGNFTTISVPGSDSTISEAINDSGTVAGIYFTGGLTHGFLRDAAGHFTTFDIPGTVGFGVEAINDLGMVAGVVRTTDQQLGYLRDAAGNITTFNPVPSAIVTGVSLNNAGMLAGTIFISDGHQTAFAETRASTQTQLTAAPGQSGVGQPLTFTAVVTSGQGGFIPTGNVTFSIDGVAASTVPLTLVGGQIQASLSLATLPAGAHTVTATYGGTTGLAPSAISQAVQVVPAPTVDSVQRFGFHATPTRIVLSFSTALDPTRAEDVHNYKIVGPGGRIVAIDRAVYSPLSNTVVLTPHIRLDIHRIYQLTVNGSRPSGLTDTFGTLLDGAGNGQPGSNFVTNLTAANLVLGTQVPGGPARLAHLRAIVATIEANQSKQLARLHHSSTIHIATPKRPVSMATASPKPIMRPALRK